MDLSLIVSLHIEAGPAWRNLTTLSEQTHIGGVGWVGEEILHIRTPAVNGRYSVAEGWCAVLKGTGLIWHVTGHSLSVRAARPGEYEALCQPRTGWGPSFIHPPQADWK